MPEIREFRLGDLLSLTLHMPIGDVGGLVRFMAGGAVFPLYAIPHVLAQCTAGIVEQHPWVAGITFPDWLVSRRNDWAAFWAWIDTLELKHGRTHQVTPLDDLSVPRAQEVSFQDLPADIKATLRELGFEGLGGDDSIG